VRLNRQLDAPFKMGLLTMMGALGEAEHSRDLRLVLCGVAGLSVSESVVGPLRPDENSGELVGVAGSTQYRSAKSATAHGGCRFQLPTGRLLVEYPASLKGN
jgi:hypothetical protein